MNKFAKIEKVYEIAIHAYDNSQRETACRVKLSNGRRCWLVGYGADYLPAAKSDIENLYNHQNIARQDDGSEAFEIASRLIGTQVWAYRNR